MYPLAARRQIGGMGIGGGTSLLPYIFDPSALGDGALPSPWAGATWAISGGKIINTPNEGASVVTNGDMETGSPPTGWTGANCTLAADADVHGGSQSLKATSTAVGGLAQTSMTVVANKLYVYSLWVKRTAGQIDLLNTFQTFPNFGYNNLYHVAPASYTNYRGVALTSGTLNIFQLRGFDNGTVAYWDDVTYKPVEWNEAINSIDFGVASPASVKAAITLTNYSPAGVVCNLDSQTNPKYFILAVRQAQNGIGLFRCNNGTITQLIDSTATYSVGAQLEIRKTAADVYQLWYNGAQIGANQTVTDANLNNNTRHGIFNVGGGANLGSFFVLAS